jgi:hypothetical protein
MEGEKVGMWVDGSRDGWLEGGKEEGRVEGATGWRDEGEGGRTDRWMQGCENE